MIEVIETMPDKGSILDLSLYYLKFESEILCKWNISWMVSGFFQNFLNQTFPQDYYDEELSWSCIIKH